MLNSLFFLYFHFTEGSCYFLKVLERINNTLVMQGALEIGWTHLLTSNIYVL